MGRIDVSGRGRKRLLHGHPWIYADDVAPILMARCGACHREGGVAPWAMTSFSVVQGWSPMIREVVRTIVMSPEFLSREAYRAKVKTPLEWTAGSVRGLGVDVENMRLLMGVLQRLDQPLYGYGPPTGYPDVAEAWVSASALLQRAELSRRIGTAGSQRGRWGGEAGAEADRVDVVLERLLPGAETKRLKRVIESEVEASAPTEAEGLATTIALTLASPEFQRK